MVDFHAHFWLILSRIICKWSNHAETIVKLIRSIQMYFKIWKMEFLKNREKWFVWDCSRIKEVNQTKWNWIWQVADVHPARIGPDREESQFVLRRVHQLESNHRQGRTQLHPREFHPLPVKIIPKNPEKSRKILPRIAKMVRNSKFWVEKSRKLIQNP